MRPPGPNPAILHVSIPAGEDRTRISDSDPWLSECWLFNITGASGTFTVTIEDVSGHISSYDTHLVIALNDVAYNNLVSLTVDDVTIVKNDFRYGTLRPYNLRDWPSGDVYPTWFNDTLVKVGTIPPKGHTNVTVSVRARNATGARMHFDAYGSKKLSPIPPTKKCYVTHNPLSEDSTVLFWPPPLIPPVACFTVSNDRPNVCETVTFNATCSYDPDGWIVNHTWNFGDCNITTVAYPIITHHYDTCGNYTAILTVVDNDGLTDSKSKPIWVSINYTLTINIVGSGSVTKNPDWATYPCGTQVALTANPDPCWTFSGWSGDSSGTNPQITITMDSDKTITATFTQINYTLTITTTGGTTSPSPGSYEYPCSSNVQVTATPDSCYQFDHWEFDSSWNYSNPITVHMGDNHTLKAVFVRKTLWLTIQVYGTGTTDPAPGAYEYNCSEYVSVTAIETDLCWNFDHWELDGSPAGSDNPITVHMDANHTLQAVFTQINYTLTITSTSSGTTNPSPGPYVHPCCTNVSVTAIPDVGYLFDHWELDGFDVGSANPYTVHMNADHTLHAVLVQETFSLTIQVDGTGTTNPSPGVYQHPCSQSVSVTAIETDLCWNFDHWELDGSPAGSDNPITVHMDANHTLTAVFSKINYTLTITTTTGGTTSPSPGAHVYPCSTNVQVTAIPDSGYEFDHWELDGSPAGSANPKTVHMDQDHTLHAIFKPRPTPPPAVGGYAVPIDSSHLLALPMGFASRIGLALTSLVAMAVMIILIRRRNKIL